MDGVRFLMLLRNIGNLSVMRQFNMNLVDYDIDEDKNKYVAVFSPVSKEKPFWYIFADPRRPNENVLILEEAKSVKRIALTYNNELKLEQPSVAILSKILFSTAITVFSVIRTVLATEASEDRGVEYYRVYPQFSDFQQGRRWNVVMLVNDDEKVAFENGMSNTDLMRPVNKVGNITVDVIGYKSVTTSDSSEESGNSTVVNVPLFKLVINSGWMGITRYVNQPALKDDGTQSKAELQSLETPKLSKYTTNIDIGKSLSLDPEDEHALYNKIQSEIIENWIVRDDLSSKTMFDSNRDVAVLARMEKLNELREHGKCFVINANDTEENITNEGHLPEGYGIDDFLDCYPLTDLGLTIHVSRAGIKPICISYSASPFGTLAELYIKPDEYSIKNKKNLPDPSNYFTIEKSTKVILRYSNLKGGRERAGLTIDVAMSVIHDIISLSAAMKDIAKSAYFMSYSVMYSEKSIDDQNMVSVTEDLELRPGVPPTAHALIHSPTNNRTNRVNCSIMNSSVGKVLVCTVDGLSKKKVNEAGREIMTPRRFIYQSSENGESIFDECKNFYDACESDDPKSVMTRKEHQNIGAVVSSLVQMNFTSNVTTNMKGKTVGSGENVQNKVYDVLKFRSTLALGQILLDVRDAFIKTFGPGVIGTPDNPSRMSSPLMDTSTYNYGISRNEEGNLVQVLTSFSITEGASGSFTAMYNEDGVTDEDKMSVYCQFTNKDKKVTPLREDGELSDEFLKWYLVDCFNFNEVAQCIGRYIRRNELQGEANGSDDPTPKFRISERVVNYLAPLVREDEEDPNDGPNPLNIDNTEEDYEEMYDNFFDDNPYDDDDVE